MAFKGLRFAGLEWKNITASKIMWVVIAAIAVMPLLYGALYLAAFQDPYARLNEVPVAVVNEDKGASIATENRNLGNEVVDQLKGTDNGLQWHFVSEDQAQQGIEDGQYYMVCRIPDDFSQSVASADSDSPQKAQLKVEYNQSQNMLASQIGETVWKEVRQRLSDTISTQYWNTVLNRVSDSGNDIQTAADGAGTLRDGLHTAQDGSDTITTNLGTLEQGANTLHDGLGTLSGGIFTLQNGLSALSNGGHSLQAGTGSLVDGAKQLKDGTQQVSSGANNLAASTSSNSELGSGATDLSTGLETIQEMTRALPDQTQKLSDGLDNLISSVSGSLTSKLIPGSGQVAQGLQGVSSSGMGAISAGSSNASSDLDGTANEISSAADILASSTASEEDKEKVLKALKQASGNVTNAQSELTALNTTKIPKVKKEIDELSSGAAQVEGGLKQLNGTLTDKQGSVAQLQTGLRNLAGTSPLLSSGIQDAAAGAARVSGGIQKVNAGANSLASGASQVNAGAFTAVSGAGQLNAGAQALSAGADSAHDGASKLHEGAESAKDGSSQIASGAGQLKDGSATLSSGLQSAVDGAGKLSSKLGEGAQTAKNETGNIAGKSEMMGSPVQLTSDHYTSVKNYGTGFAPYFMALGLWVGGLVAGFVFKPLNKRLIMSGGSPFAVVFANYLPVAFFSLIQATLLMLVLQFGLQLQIDNVPAYYAMGYLTALVFSAIMQFLMAALGFPGRFLAIILLMLQLTACAGTFPIQTTPDFFQVVNPYMPMTYVVQGMRQIMTGLDYAMVGFDCTVLIGIGIACFVLTCVVAYRKRTVRMDDLHPLLQLG